MVGSSDTASGNTRAFLYGNGKMTDLGTLPGGTGSDANGINDSGQVVGLGDIGSHDENGNPVERAFLYSTGAMTDLGMLGGWGGHRRQ